ncbi:MAG: dihydroorotate dehydrogenase (fumarate) [Verrucomicrobiales bacterium]|jgi:dihydroorotate dehydrogenase (fumarate)
MNLETDYLGLKLAHPLVASSSPLSKDIDGISRLEDAGASAIVLHSLFEEQIETESHISRHYAEYGSESYAESLSYVPDLKSYNCGTDGYLKLVQSAKERVAIPIIGSLNGVTPRGWRSYAHELEQAGIDALELNLYFVPASVEVAGAGLESEYIEVVREVREQTKIPLAVKLCPFFSSLPHMAGELVDAGADALVLFNRFYQPEIDLETLTVSPRIQLSDPDEIRLALTWIAILYGRVNADLALTTGVYSHEEVLKGIMAGARVTMMASALLKNGLGTIGTTLSALRVWMEERDYESIDQMRGSMSQQHVADPSVFVRPNYMRVLQSWRPDPSLGH